MNYFGSDRVRFQLSNYQTFQPIRICKQFRFGFGTFFRIGFGIFCPALVEMLFFDYDMH